MLLSAVSVLVVAQQSSEFPEGLMYITYFNALTIFLEKPGFSSDVSGDMW